MDTLLVSPVVPLSKSPLTRRSLLLAGLGGAAVWAAGPRSSAAISFSSGPATASQTLLPWTDLALALIQESNPSPPRAAQVLALLHVAMAEAALTARPTMPGAIAAAAATVLGHHFPQAVSRITEAERAATSSYPWAIIRSSHASLAGIAAGRRIGRQVLTWGQADGSDATWDGQRPTGSRTWQPTPPEYQENPVEPLAGTWRTWVLPRGDALRPEPPPVWGSTVWRAELLAVQEAVSKRTPEQEAAAHFWAGGPGTFTPSGIWIAIARDLIARDGLDVPAAAQALAMTSVAMVDAFICCWDAKYAYWTPRPITADPTLDVLIETPPFPSYTSGHATISAAAATVLSHLFPTDAPKLQRQAEEAKNSRLWAGIHYPLDNEMGAVGGGVIGRVVIARATATGMAWDRIHGSTSGFDEAWTTGSLAP